MRVWANCDSCSRRVAVEPPATDGAQCPDCGHSLSLPDGHDVFVSYATPDVEVARRVCAALSARKLNYWFAPEKIETGEFFAAAIAGDLKKSKMVVLVLSEHATNSPWVTAEITTAVSSHMTVLPFKIQEFDPPGQWGLLLSVIQWQEAYRGPIEGQIELLVSRVEERLRAMSAAPADPAPAGTPRRIEPRAKRGVNPRLSPYVGPQPFTPDKANRFFGRQHDAAELLRLIASHRLVLVYAPSGAGKSSLLNTLVHESLAERGLEVLPGARVGGALPEGVKAAEIRNIFTFSVVYGLGGADVPDPRCDLAEPLRMRHVRAGVRGRVIIFDQFEELFTQHAERFEDRKGFVADVVEAMRADPGLRAVFALRQEYLADLDPLLGELPDDLRAQRFALRRLDLGGALEAIVGPAQEFADFAEQVAEGIVRQLNTIRVAGFDGVVVEKRGEFIEMVHLQIVCQRLWAALPEGVTRIERGHVERAAGPGKSFGDFVVNALNAFYDDTLEAVARSRQTREAGGYSKELLQLGCMKFVTVSATRTMIQRKGDRTGRLPNWIVDQLEKNHLLRFESRGGSQWYELSHDRLADPVARRINREVSKLLFAADLLDAHLSRVKEEGREDLAGYFVAHRDVLAECQTFHRQVGLFEDEAEFVFRASLAAGVDCGAWSRRLARDFPGARRRALKEALAYPEPAVRANAADLLGEEFEPEFAAELVRLALDDGDAGVRAAATASLARLDQSPLFDEIKARLASPQTHRAASQAVANLLVLSDLGGAGAAFAGFYRGIGTGTRARIRARAWGLRFVNNFSALPYVVIPAALFSATSAGLFKWLPGVFGYAHCQAAPSLLAGLFHGFTAAAVWSAFISFALMIHRVVFYRKTGAVSCLRPFTALAWGAAAGALAGATMTLIISGVFLTTSLATMGWVSGGDVKQFSAEFWYDLFVRTRFGWAYIISGAGAGVAFAITGNGMRASGQFDFKNTGSSVSGGREFWAIIGQLMKLAARYLWAFPLCLAVAGAVVMMILRPGEAMSPAKKSFSSLLLATFFDSASLWFGGYFSMIGFGLGLVLMTRGVRVEPRKDQI
jgi:hypothetical protein